MVEQNNNGKQKDVPVVVSGLDEGVYNIFDNKEKGVVEVRKIRTGYGANTKETQLPPLGGAQQFAAQ
jgi:predicted secreted acid phosphatase